MHSRKKIDNKIWLFEIVEAVCRARKWKTVTTNDKWCSKTVTNVITRILFVLYRLAVCMFMFLPFMQRIRESKIWKNNPKHIHAINSQQFQAIQILHKRKLIHTIFGYKNLCLRTRSLFRTKCKICKTKIKIFVENLCTTKIGAIVLVELKVNQNNAKEYLIKMNIVFFFSIAFNVNKKSLLLFRIRWTHTADTGALFSFVDVCYGRTIVYSVWSVQQRTTQRKLDMTHTLVAYQVWYVSGSIKINKAERKHTHFIYGESENKWLRDNLTNSVLWYD